MNRFCKLLSACVLFALLTGQCFAAVSINTLTYSASLSFADQQVPQIMHKGLERISRITKYAVIQGTAADNSGLGDLNVNYYFDDETMFSTTTIKITKGLISYFKKTMLLSIKNEKNFYYRIVSDDASNNLAYWPAAGFKQVPISAGSTKQYGASGGTLSLTDGNPDDGETSIEFPQGAIDSDINISLTEIDPDDGQVPPGNFPAVSKKAVAVYRFEPSGILFRKMAKINLLFPDLDKDGIVDNTSYNINELKIMWWDGFEWRLLGTTIDPKLNLASANIKHFSYYAIFPVGALTDDDYRPKEKIITPASVDGMNDFATFGAIGPDDSINIYDVTGMRVKHIKDDNTWDGTDEENQAVESGIYIYQIKTAEKLISGTIVVAK